MYNKERTFNYKTKHKCKTKQHRSSYTVFKKLHAPMINKSGFNNSK